MKIIYENNVIRKISSAENDLADMRFYVPAYEDGVYLAKFDNQIVPLKGTSELHKKYKILRLVNVSNTFAATELSLIYIRPDYQYITTSNTIEIETTNNKYISESNAMYNVVTSYDIQNMYEKIVELTKLNVKIHNEIMEVSNE